MDGGVVQVIPVGRSLDEEGVSQLVCAAAWNFVGPVVVSYVVNYDYTISCSQALMKYPV